jgi:hypothetical protein
MPGQIHSTVRVLSVASYDQLRTLYRTMLVFATFGVVILAVGLLEFVHFEQPGQTSGVKAHILGVYQYDPVTGSTSGPDGIEFSRSDQIAAVVDWSSVPSDLTVDAKWLDSFGDVVGRVGPATPAELANHMIIPIVVPQGLHHSLPGHYTFVVERIQGDIPVEVLGRRIILVDRS